MTFVLKNKDRVRAISFILLIQKSVYVNIFTNRKKLQKKCLFYKSLILDHSSLNHKSRQILKFWRTSRTITAELHCNHWCKQFIKLRYVLWIQIKDFIVYVETGWLLGPDLQHTLAWCAYFLERYLFMLLMELAYTRNSLSSWPAVNTLMLRSTLRLPETLNIPLVNTSAS